MSTLTLLLLLGKTARCPDSTVHWLQPGYYDPSIIDHTVLQSKGAYEAWCYPTAAASLLGTLANGGKWNSGMKESDRYSNLVHYQDSKNPPARTDPWKDYSWHETNTKFNLGYYMKTNNPDPGTTLEDGKKGIEDFIKYIDPTKVAKVTIHSGNPGINQKTPLLLHIASRCIPTTESMKNTDSVVLNLNNNFEDGTIDEERINNSPENLGHTVVAYGAEYDTNSPANLIFNVAMNLPTLANPDGTKCDSTRLQLSPDQLSCITHFTTVDIQNKGTETDDNLTPGAIIGIAIGGTVLVGVAGYVIYRWRKNPGRLESTTSRASSLIF